MNPQDPHAGQPVLTRGPTPEQAAVTLVMIHGRGASAESILSLHDALQIDGLAAAAPQAARGTWYPQSFLAPLTANQPYLDSALRRIEFVVENLIARGVPSERIALLGFSQGACLTSEFAARHPRRYRAVMILTGGLIGPEGTPRGYTDTFDGTPIFMGTSDPDPHVPYARAVETEAVLRGMGAATELRRYSGMPHTINEDELEAYRGLLSR
jgi:predicted esterase